jgi:hypothetical protein
MENEQVKTIAAMIVLEASTRIRNKEPYRDLKTAIHAVYLEVSDALNFYYIGEKDEDSVHREKSAAGNSGSNQTGK